MNTPTTSLFVRTVARSPQGYLYPGTECRWVDPADVRKLGKVAEYGTFVKRFTVRLADDTLLFVCAAEQPDQARNWLYKLAKGFKGTSWWATRESVQNHTEIEVAS